MKSDAAAASPTRSLPICIASCSTIRALSDLQRPIWQTCRTCARGPRPLHAARSSPPSARRRLPSPATCLARPPRTVRRGERGAEREGGGPAAWEAGGGRCQLPKPAGPPGLVGSPNAPPRPGQDCCSAGGGDASGARPLALLPRAAAHSPPAAPAAPSLLATFPLVLQLQVLTFVQNRANECTWSSTRERAAQQGEQPARQAPAQAAGARGRCSGVARWWRLCRCGFWHGMSQTDSVCIVVPCIAVVRNKSGHSTPAWRRAPQAAWRVAGPCPSSHAPLPPLLSPTQLAQGCRRLEAHACTRRALAGRCHHRRRRCHRVCEGGWVWQEVDCQGVIVGGGSRRRQSLVHVRRWGGWAGSAAGRCRVSCFGGRRAGRLHNSRPSGSAALWHANHPLPSPPRAHHPVPPPNAGRGERRRRRRPRAPQGQACGRPRRWRR